MNTQATANNCHLARLQLVADSLLSEQAHALLLPPAARHSVCSAKRSPRCSPAHATAAAPPVQRMISIKNTSSTIHGWQKQMLNQAPPYPIWQPLAHPPAHPPQSILAPPHRSHACRLQSCRAARHRRPSAPGRCGEREEDSPRNCPLFVKAPVVHYTATHHSHFT